MITNLGQAPVKCLLFDMDNTLFDLVGAQISACQAVALHLGHDDGEVLFSYFLTPTHGFESHENIRQYMNDKNIPVDRSFHMACKVYEKVKLQHIHAYEGVTDTLRLLYTQGYNMGIVTDAYSRDAIPRLEKTGLLSFFCGMVTYDMVKVKKPAREPFLLALEMMKSGTNESILIGDSPRRDIEPGHNLGIRTIYARYGDRFSNDRSGKLADFVIDSFSDLPEILYGLRRSD
jgi:putative hydrolase of the HAD superfamily